MEKCQSAWIISQGVIITFLNSWFELTKLDFDTEDNLCFCIHIGKHFFAKHTLNKNNKRTSVIQNGLSDYLTMRLSKDSFTENKSCIFTFSVQACLVLSSGISPFIFFLIFFILISAWPHYIQPLASRITQFGDLMNLWFLKNSKVSKKNSFFISFFTIKVN